MNPAPRYVLHIGYGKTGSTGIQRLLSCNRATLLKQGILYPDARARGAWLGLGDHNMLGRALAGRVGWWGLSAQDFIEQFERQRQRTAAHTILLSGEAFLGGVQPWDFSDAASYRSAAADAVRRLGSLIDGCEVSVVVYLRRQDHWLESVINQNIKFGGLVGQRLAALSPEETAAVYAPRLDYAETLAAWADTFGADALDIGVYEREQLYGGDVIADFLRRMDMETCDVAQPCWDDRSRNTAFGRDLLEFKRVLNAIPKPKYEERALVEELRAVAGEMGDRGTSDAPLVDAALRRRILEENAEGNAAVARIYLGRGDGDLFREPWPRTDGSEPVYPGLSTELALEIELRLERHRQSLRGRLRRLRHWLAELLRRRSPVTHALARTVRAFSLRAMPQRES